MKYYIAIDIGASSGRHILAHLENGVLVTEEIYRFANGPVSRDGHLMWDVDRLYAEILAGLKVAGDMGKIPAAVGIDTWGVDYVLLDENDAPIGGAYCYRDSRNEAASKAVHAILPFSELYRKTGIMFNTFNTVYQLYDDVQTGRIQNAKNFLMLPDYFHFRLTGVKKHEYTNGTTTGLVNAKTHTWDGEILQKLGIPAELLGTLTQPGECVGAFSAETAAAVGYTSKIVLPSTHDTASAVLAAPLLTAAPYISSGTWSLLGVEQKDAFTSPEAEASEYSNEGTYGYHFRLQKNIMGLWMIQQVRHETGDAYSFAELAALAEKNPVDDVVNVNDARFLAPENMTNEIKAAVGRDLTLGQIAYIIYHSLAVSYRDSLKALEALTGETFDTLHIIGGGSKNELLNRMTKELTGKTIITGPTEGTAIGNLMMQLIGEGELSSIAEGREVVVRSFDIKKI